MKDNNSNIIDAAEATGMVISEINAVFSCIRNGSWTIKSGFYIDDRDSFIEERESIHR